MQALGHDARDVILAGLERASLALCERCSLCAEAGVPLAALWEAGGRSLSLFLLLLLRLCLVCEVEPLGNRFVLYTPVHVTL